MQLMRLHVTADEVLGNDCHLGDPGTHMHPVTAGTVTRSSDLVHAGMPACASNVSAVVAKFTGEKSLRKGLRSSNSTSARRLLILLCLGCILPTNDGNRR